MYYIALPFIVAFHLVLLAIKLFPLMFILLVVFILCFG